MDQSAIGTGRVAPGLIGVFWRHKVLVLTVTVLFAVAGWAVSHLQPTEYTAHAKLVLEDPSQSSVFGNQQTVLDPARYVRARAEYMTSTGVLARAAGMLEPRMTTDDLRSAITVTAAKELDLVTIDASGSTPEGAAARANALISAYETESARATKDAAVEATKQLDISKRSLQKQIDGLDNQIAGSAKDNSAVAGLNAQRAAASTQLFSLQSQADRITADAALSGSGVQLAEKAEPPVSRSKPRPLGAAVIAAFIGFLLAMALAWWRSENRQRADDRLDPAQALGLPLLAEVPDFAGGVSVGVLPANDSSQSGAGEAYHFLVASLGFALDTKQGSTVLITSARPGDGKTVTAANLAVAAMRDGRRVVVVDADERARGLTTLTGVAMEPGLTDLTDESMSIERVTSQMPLGDGDSLAVIPAGHRLPDPAGFFRSGDFRRAMTRAKSSMDLVIVDSPPLLAVSDSSAIASHVDGIVIVVGRGTPIRILREVRERLEFIGTPALGYVFNRASVRRNSYGYGGYDYRRAEERKTGDTRRFRRAREKV